MLKSKRNFLKKFFSSIHRQDLQLPTIQPLCIVSSISLHVSYFFRFYLPNAVSRAALDFFTLGSCASRGFFSLSPEFTFINAQYLGTMILLFHWQWLKCVDVYMSIHPKLKKKINSLQNSCHPPKHLTSLFLSLALSLSLYIYIWEWRNKSVLLAFMF